MSIFDTVVSMPHENIDNYLSCNCIKQYLTQYRNLIRFDLYPPVFESTCKHCFHSRGYSRNAVTSPLVILVKSFESNDQTYELAASNSIQSPVTRYRRHTAEYVSFGREKSSKLVTHLN